MLISPAPITLFVRRLQDWQNCAYDKLDGTVLQEKPVRIWDRIFTYPYFKYRQAIREVAFDNWRLPWRSIPVRQFLQTVGDDELVLPVDDDDWFHPELEFYLRSCGADFVYWGDIVNQTCLYASVHSWYSCHQTMCSNNYAVRGHVLKSLAYRDAHYVLCGHSQVLDVMQSAGVDIESWPQRFLSCYNWHPGSVSALTGDQLAITERDMPRLLPKNLMTTLPPEFEWIQPWHSRFNDIVRQIRLKKLFL